ncbi:putative tRNA (uracil-O(2)-)-methyltransferase [Smittium mucronatum]|uniref:tRNA (uracil-O(2)-)-methyltransferase n=1 Tax=Smittium mucronatum TaxID=133383 RepID=A0A1R0H7I4_9FUNG|nr:putative tRNA (uracil-O(2)-)-methyltransferase [Smittium mucronatum]
MWSVEKKKPTFVDLGCGNGLLVYILNCEGFLGYGIDQSSRKIWSKFDPKPQLRALTIMPYELVVDSDWIIGNHADELVPWYHLI